LHPAKCRLGFGDVRAARSLRHRKRRVHNKKLFARRNTAGRRLRGRHS
jgi:hypothetical protein